MIKVTIFNKEYKVTKRISRMLDSANGDNSIIAFILGLGQKCGEITDKV